jgi:hypothetical protein
VEAAAVTENAYHAAQDFSQAQVEAVMADGSTRASAKVTRETLKKESAVTVASAEEWERTDLSKFNTVTIDMTDGFDISGMGLLIPAQVYRLVLLGQAGKVYEDVCIEIAVRTASLVVACSDFSAVAASGADLIRMESADGYTPTLILENKGACTLSGGNGAAGARGTDGAPIQHGTDGSAGGAGGAAVVADRVLVAGEGRLALCGGSGGKGGMGGLGNGLNNPGDGGAGGNGGDAVKADRVAVYMKSGAACYFTGGEGGAGGQAGDKQSTSFGSSSDGAAGAAGQRATAEIDRIRGIVK